MQRLALIGLAGAAALAACWFVLFPAEDKLVVKVWEIHSRAVVPLQEGPQSPGMLDLVRARLGQGVAVVRLDYLDLCLETRKVPLGGGFRKMPTGRQGRVVNALPSAASVRLVGDEEVEVSLGEETRLLNPGEFWAVGAALSSTGIEWVDQEDDWEKRLQAWRQREYPVSVIRVGNMGILPLEKILEREVAARDQESLGLLSGPDHDGLCGGARSRR